jgi:peptidoglycan/xylan/chitin deacetylase (PgdA/CDA1 family)
MPIPPRRTLAVLLAVILTAVSFTLRAQTPREEPERRMVVTFDDLPYQNDGADQLLADVHRVTAKLVGALRLHRAPAVGFVNESRLHVIGEVDARVGTLQEWVDAGLVLGNHTFSHLDLNTVSIEQFQDDIVRGDVVSRRLMRSRTPYQLYFRHPYTHTGNDLAKKQAVAEFLAARGYRVAPHTVDNQDFVFNRPYVQALRSGDEPMAERLRRAYIDFTVEATDFAERISPHVFGRVIPQTILLHANDITADTLEELLRIFEGRGYRFVSLDDAMTDDAYATEDTLVTRFGPTWLWRWTKSKSLNVSFKGDPEPPSWVTELYSRR